MQGPRAAICAHVDDFLSQVEYASDRQNLYSIFPFLLSIATHVIISLPMLKLVDTSRYFCNTYISMANNWCFRRILSGGKQVVVMSVSRVLRLPEEICGPRYKGSTLLPGLAKPKRVHLMKVPVIQLWWRISYVILDESTKAKAHLLKKYFGFCCNNLICVYMHNSIMFI